MGLEPSEPHKEGAVRPSRLPVWSKMYGSLSGQYTQGIRVPMNRARPCAGKNEEFILAGKLPVWSIRCDFRARFLIVHYRDAVQTRAVQLRVNIVMTFIHEIEGESSGKA